MLFFSRNTR